MKTSQLARFAVASATFAILATGCGANPGVDPYAQGYGADPYANSDPYANTDPYAGGSNSGSYGGTTGSTGSYGGTTGSYGGTSGSYGGTSGSYGSTTGSYGGTTGAQAGIAGAELKVGKVDKAVKGFLFWKKLTISSQISNPSQAVLSGEILVNFTKKGKVVETQTEFVTDLAPQQAHSFTLTSKKSADDVEISCVSKPGQASAPSYGSGSGYGTGSSAGYGSGTSGGYGSGTSGGYGSGTSGGYGSGSGTSGTSGGYGSY